MTPSKQIAILIISCDKYSDLWEPATKMFNKNWPDCPYDKYLASNKKGFNDFGFSQILTGEDKVWSYGLKCALKELQEKYEYVFTLFEDTMFIERLDNNYMTKVFNSFVLEEGNFLRFYRVLKPKVKYYNEFYGETDHTPYRQTSVFSLWKIKTFLEILKDDENSWEFEKIGVKRSFRYDKFFSVYKNPFKAINVVIQGKLVPRDYKILKQILPEINSDRPSYTSLEMVFMRTRTFFVLCFLTFVPKKIRSKIYFSKYKELLKTLKLVH